MNIVYLIGMLLAFGFTAFGIIVGITVTPGGDPMFAVSFSPASLWNFFDVSSILIVIGGTIAVVVACYPKQAKDFIKHFRILLRVNAFDPAIYIDQLTELAQIARKNGLLAL